MKFERLSCCSLIFLFFLALITSFYFGLLANAGTASTSVTVTVSQCSDSSDNDGDGLIDYPADPGCSSATDDDETDPVVTREIPVITVGAGGYSAPLSSKELQPAGKILRVCDFNGDNKCNIIDFSILLYHMSQPTTIASRYDLNGDGKINLIDISILFYHWA